jgi:hypothetical protein
MDLHELLGLGGAAVVVALVEAAKLVWPELRPRWYPLLALGCGVLWNAALATLLGVDLGRAAALGVVTGLAASGLYSGGKAVVADGAQRAA